MARGAKTDEFQFEGFDSPNYTQVPDILLDFLAPRLTEAELRVALYVVRRTLGFKKNSDQISLTQMTEGITTRDGRVLDYGTGMSRRGVMKGCAGLVQKGIIEVEKQLSEQGDNEINVYRLRFKKSDGAGVGNYVPYGREPCTPPVGNKGAPQETGVQETGVQETGVQETGVQQTELISNERETASLHKTNDRIQRKPALRQLDVDNVAERAERVAGPHQAPPAGWSSTEQILFRMQSQRQAPRGSGTGDRRSSSSGRPPKAPPYIAAVMEDISGRLHDDTPRASVTRATRLWRASGLAEERFVHDVLYPARSRTQQQGGVKKRARAGDGTINRVPYFFAVVEDLLGLKA